ncbi:hypothetical protein C5167_010653 [Papaver somniferum]|uniref:Cytochrome P450 n=1 Tax=Papaver somniferum TaxID=3469 RepID=A0A4Y7K4Q3_PAPSO|nr:isoflavone 2'-hydroxylase-like [Papaver somniferum]RZC66975.1 hypothetical protein C5167_010653 [Papaver somniferum]
MAVKMIFDFFFVSNYYYYFLLFVSILLISNLFSKKSTKNKPPTPPALPIIGHLHLINKPLNKALKGLSDRYGPVLLLRFGSQSVLALSSPSSVEECLTKNDIIFANRPPVVAAKHLGYNYKTVEWSSYGPNWRNLRRVMNMDIFSSGSLQTTSNIRNEEVQYMMHQLYQRSLSSSSSDIFHEVDLKSMFFELGFNIIMKMVSGKRYNGDKKWSFDSLVRESFLPKTLVHMVDFLPVLQWIDYQSTEKKLKQVKKNKDAFLDELIQETLKTSTSKAETEHKSLIEVFMSLQQDEPETYTDEVVKGIIGAMFSAGIETSRATMVAAISLLVKNPEALTKLREEIDFHVEEGRFISESDLPKLSYLQCVIQESLRLHPPAPIPLPHISSQDCTIAGYDIPRGTMLLLNAWAIQRDTKWWDEPTKFKPERFDRESAIKEGKMDGFRWIPFGAGRRGCPGSGMAFRVTSLAIGGLIQCLEWKKVDHDDQMIEEEGDEPSSRAMYRPRLVKKDVLSQI